MTTLLDPPLGPAANAPGQAEAVTGPDVEHTPAQDGLGETAPPEPDGAAPRGEDEQAIAPGTLALTAASAALAAGGAAWMVGGIFRGAEARLVGFLGVALGASLVYLGIRFRMRVATYLVLPAALVLGAVLMSSASGGGTSSLPALVRDAATSSQVLQPPIDFAPGWRLILLVLLALATSSGLTLALSLNRPRLAVAVPTPLTVAAALIQPGSTAIMTSAISVGFVMMALATSYAADGVGDTFDRRFETRRLLRSAVAGVLFVVGLILASKVSFLFPTSDPHRVIPPRRPPVSPPQPDVPLYTVKGIPPGPLRVGVIDVYDVKEGAWLLPPVDNQRLVRLHLPADVPSAPPAAGKPVHLSITVQQAKGHLLPALAGMRRVEGGTSVDYDPRSQTLDLSERPVYTGLTYAVDASTPPTGAQLSHAPDTVPPPIKQFLTAPPVPPEVQSLLQKAPAGRFAKLQYLRAALYKHFIAVGQGKPTDVSADRVVQLLSGGPKSKGNPYELTAAEGLLARWAQVPARIGFGYYNGTPKPGGVIEFRPTNAATYLEVYFAPYGWVPIVGTPPRAQQSLSNNQHNNNPDIKPSPELGINVYLPIRQVDHIPLYVYARYYLLRALPVIVGLCLLLLLYPLGLKRLRRRRRLAWAAANGPTAAIAVAYCDLRDKMIDLALPGRGMTPLELVELVDEDEEHAELGWLVTRGLWGDLRHEITDVDAVFARRLADSVSMRLAKAQPETARLLAAVSRASLKSPYSLEVPNVWWRLRLRERIPRPHRPRLTSFVRLVRRLRPGVATSVLAVLAAIGLGGCSASASAAHADPVAAFPTRLAPAIVGGLEAKEEPRAEAAYVNNAKNKDVLVSEGKVISFNRNGLVQAALQVAQLKPGYATSSPDVVKAITSSVGDNGLKQLRAEGPHALWAQTDGSQRIFLWFPTVKAMAMLVVRAEISEGAAESMARGLIDYGDGGSINERALAAALASTPAGADSGPPVVAPDPGVTPPPGAAPTRTSTRSTVSPTPSTSASSEPKR
jgi:hypothetical protein